MRAAYHILYHGGATGTHQKLALKALTALHESNAAWRDLMVAHGGRYLDGAAASARALRERRDPSARLWFGRLAAALENGAWEDAAFAAGALGPCVADPLAPLRDRAQEESANIRRALECSVEQAFDRIWDCAPPPQIAWPDIDAPDPNASESADWLDRLIHDAEAIACCERLLTRYRLDLAARRPEDGLDQSARELLAPLLARATRRIARALERAFEACPTWPPDISPLTTAGEALAAPARRVAGWMEARRAREEIRRIHEDFTLEGRLRRARASQTRAPRASRRTAQDPNAPQEPTICALVLRRADPVGWIPCVAPETGARLKAIGVARVGDLLDAHPGRVAEALDDGETTADMVGEWRDQATLLTRLPRLEPEQAALLVAAGYRDLTVIAQAHRGRLFQALTNAWGEIGRGAPPDPESVESLIRAARAVLSSAQAAA